MRAVEKEQPHKQSVQDTVAMHYHWLKIFVVVIITLSYSYQIWRADFSQAFVEFAFSDLLAMLLAMFAIALSVLFILKLQKLLMFSITTAIASLKTFP